MTENEQIAALRKQVEDLTAVVAELTTTRLFNNSGRAFPPSPLMFRDLGLSGPHQARVLMQERGLLPADE